tara:strand:+ start:564 stop:1805 length:1242 start_codon:yes stop_codon:yes gene_type:complete
MKVINYGAELAPSMQNFGNALRYRNERNEAEAARQKQQEALKQAAQLYSTGTPDEIARFSIENPQAAKLLSEQIGYKDEATKQNALETMRGILTNPERAEELLQNRVNYLKSVGADPSETLGEIEFLRSNPEGYADIVEKAYAFKDPAGHKAYRSTLGGGSSVPSYSNVNFDESGKPYGLNKATGNYEEIGGGFVKGKAAPSTIVNMGRAESEQSKVIAKAEGENYNSYISDAKAARKSDAALNRLSGLTEKAFSGTLAPAYKAGSKLASSLGIDVEGLKESELFDALSNELILSQTSKLTGVLTDADMRFLANTVPQLSQSKEGRKALIGVMKEVNSAIKERARLAAKFRASQPNQQFDEMKFMDYLQSQPKKDRFSKINLPKKEKVPSGLGSGNVADMSDEDLMNSLNIGG